MAHSTETTGLISGVSLWFNPVGLGVDDGFNGRHVGHLYVWDHFNGLLDLAGVSDAVSRIVLVCDAFWDEPGGHCPERSQLGVGQFQDHEYAGHSILFFGGIAEVLEGDTHHVVGVEDTDDKISLSGLVSILKSPLS